MVEIIQLRKKNNPSAKVKVAGSLLPEGFNELKKVLLNVISQNTRIIISVEGSIDSCLQLMQLLIAVNNSIALENKSYSCEIEFTPEQTRFLDLAGFNRILGVLIDKHKIR